MIKAIGNLFLNLGRYVVEQVRAGTQQVVDLLLPVRTTAVAVAGAAPGAFPLSARQRQLLEGWCAAPPRRNGWCGGLALFWSWRQGTLPTKWPSS